MKHNVLFYERLKGLMAEKEINQRQLERDTGLSNQAISFWLSQQRVPSLPSLWDLADYFHCSIDYLAGREDDR